MGIIFSSRIVKHYVTYLLLYFIKFFSLFNIKSTYLWIIPNLTFPDFYLCYKPKKNNLVKT